MRAQQGSGRSRSVRRACRAGAALVGILLLAPSVASASVQTQTFRVGPISLDGYQTREPDLHVPAPRVDGFLVAMHAYVVDAAGHRIDQTRVMLHHAVFVNEGRFTGDRSSDYCGVRPREPFYGTAEEDQTLRLPAGYGYPVHDGDRWRLRYMMMNHKAPHRDVYLRYSVVTDTAPKIPVTPHWVSVACRLQRIYNVFGGGAPGSETVKSTVWHVPASGRIVALAGHLHGGGRRIDLRQPACGNRVLVSSSARYGLPDDPVYAMSPMLHEPSPRSVSVSRSVTGWPVRAGEAIQVDSVYDAARPHVKVMGIAHVYVAEGADGSGPACPELPGDVVDRREPFLGAPGRPDPPTVAQDLSRRDAAGVAHPIPGLTGTPVRLGSTATVDIRHFAFWPQRISVPAGATIRWRFQDRQRHDVSWVHGPLGFGSRYQKRGDQFTTRLTAPGTYSYFCSLHPVDMPATIEVRPAGR